MAIDPGVLRECLNAYVEKYNERDASMSDGVRAALEKYRELTPQPGPILPAVPDAIRKACEEALACPKSFCNSSLMVAQWVLVNRPAPAVVVPEEIAEWANFNAMCGGPDDRVAANWIKSLVPAPPVPEPGQREMETFCKFQPGLNRMKWADCDQSERDGWAAVAALKGDADV